MPTLVVDLQDRRPVWSLPGWARDKIRSAVPSAWSVAFLDTPADGSGDGALRAPPELLRAVADARAYMGYGVPTQVLEAGRRLEWVHSAAAGVGSSLGSAMLERDILFTNSAGVHGPPMAESVVAMLLYFARGLDLAVRAQQEGRWGAESFWAADSPVAELAGSTVGIVGYGGVGREVARRASCLGSRVVAVRRTESPAPPDTPEVEPAPKVETGPKGLARVLEQSDYVVLAVPETPRTRNLIDRRRIFSMKRGAVLVNVARGRVLDEEALLEALDADHLRGAALDVFHAEPLPPDHPFYRHPRVLVTPHVSATTRRFWEREADLIADNIARFARGEPLRNLVDKSAGY